MNRWACSSICRTSAPSRCATPSRSSRAPVDLQPFLGPGVTITCATSPTTCSALAGNGGVCMVTFVPDFVSADATSGIAGRGRRDGGGRRGHRGTGPRTWPRRPLREAASGAGRDHRRRSPTTSTTYGRSPGSSTSASAATSTAATAAGRSGRRHRLPGADRRALDRGWSDTDSPRWPAATSCGCCATPSRSPAEPSRSGVPHSCGRLCGGACTNTALGTGIVRPGDVQWPPRTHRQLVAGKPLAGPPAPGRNCGVDSDEDQPGETSEQRII